MRLGEIRFQIIRFKGTQTTKEKIMKHTIKASFIFILSLLLTVVSCKKDDPAPALSIISIKSGTVDLNSGTSATKVSVSSPIVVILSTMVDATTATSSNITLTKGTTNVPISISVTESTITITPAASLTFDTSYSLVISNAVKSDRGVSLTNQTSLSFTTETNPAPPLSVISIKSGTIDLNSGTSATKVSISLPIVVVLSTKVDAATATANNITLTKGTTNVPIGISVTESSITITPTSNLTFDANYSLTISNSVKSDKGVSLSNQILISFTTEPPPLSITSIKSGTIDLNSGTSATKVSISLPIVVVLSTKVDATTATASNITLTKGTSNIAIGISVTDATITITPTNNLAVSTNYSLTITNGLKSDKGVSLTSQVSLSFTTDEPTKVFFFLVTATPTDQESITLKNNSGADQDLTGWTLGDTNNPVAYNIPNGTIIKQGETKTFSHTTIGFAINDSGEILYLKNAGVEIDRWTN
jgi:hypothetical protein